MNKLFKRLFLLLLVLFIPLTSILAEDDLLITEKTGTDMVNIDENLDTTGTSDIENEDKYSIVLEDDANLLSEEELEKLKEVMVPLTEYGNIIFKTINDNSYGSTSSFAENYYYDRFGNNNGTMFLIDMYYRNIYIVSGGSNYGIITTAKANTITDNTYRYASREEYYECAKVAYEQMYSLLRGEKIAEPMRYASNVVISMTLALLINFLIVSSVSKIKKATNSEILKTCEIDVNVGSVNGYESGTHRVYSPVSDSSSSGGGGGSSGGGGGGFSGGGGGHGF